MKFYIASPVGLIIISVIFTLYGVMSKNKTAWETSESFNTGTPHSFKLLVPSSIPAAVAISVTTRPGLISFLNVQVLA